jgi:hypothetical protein
MLLVSGSAHAQANRAAKMFIIANNGVTVTDYPTIERCEASKADLLRQAERENAATVPIRPLPNGGAIITAPISIRAFCFRA